jgi:hypothetical protein
MASALILMYASRSRRGAGEQEAAGEPGGFFFLFGAPQEVMVDYLVDGKGPLTGLVRRR